MPNLQRINYRPNTDNLTADEKSYLEQHFDAYGSDLVVHGEAIPWQIIDEVEVAAAARSRGLAGWLVKNLVMGGERYHLGIYYGNAEAVFTNISLNTAEYILKHVAYYAPQAVRYTGPEDLKI